MTATTRKRDPSVKDPEVHPDRDARPPLPVFSAGAEEVLDELVGDGLLTSQESVKVSMLLASDHTDLTLMQLILKLGLLSERDLLEFLSKRMGLKILPRSAYPVSNSGESLFNRRFLEQHRVVVVSESEHYVEICLNDPFAPGLASALSFVIGSRPLKLRLGFQQDIDDALSLILDGNRSEVAQRYETDDAVLLERDILQLKELASEAPVIKLVNGMVRDAVRSDASDIHIEPQSESIKVRNRIDGVLVTSQQIPISLTAAIVSRIKILASLDIAQRRTPQDGRFDINVDGQDVDIRVSILPTIYGESVVLRLLYKKSISFDFDRLGFSPDNRDRILRVLGRPHGLVLVTGPTGSGKSTTLYAMMQEVNNSEKKVMSVEDPVEYKIDGINQIQVNPEIGIGFSDALRAIVRHDPEVIMVGEMRDAETAEIAIRASMTGHLILTTLHTNNAVASIERLLDLGIDRSFVFTSLVAVVAQRLVRRLCSHCRQPQESDCLMIDGDASELVADESATLYQAQGCEHCNHTGYRGRLSISEVMLVNDEFRSEALAGKDSILNIAHRHGLGSMVSDGFDKVCQGETTVDELFRVVME